jgi:hypothetical protein
MNQKGIYVHSYDAFSPIGFVRNTDSKFRFRERKSTGNASLDVQLEIGLHLVTFFEGLEVNLE